MCGKNKILIVDDSPLFRTYVKGLLGSQYAMELIEINTARELFSYLRANNTEEIALVLLDLNLSDGNGLEVIGSLKENPAYRDLAIMVVSAYIDKDTALAALKAGAGDLVVKPFQPEALLERIDKLFSAEPLAGQVFLKDCKTAGDYYKQIGEEIKRAGRGNYHFSLLVTGFFRAETLSSPSVGEGCRQNIALGDVFLQVLQDSLRETDTVIRLSPHEYLLLLPFTNEQGAKKVEDNLIKAFASLLRRRGYSGLVLLTGSATYPVDSKDAREIVRTLEKRFKEQLAASA